MMRTWVVLILVVAVVGLGGAAVLARTPSAVVSPSSSSAEAMDTSETKFTAELAGLGIELEPAKATPAISRDIAIDAATKHEGERISNEAQAITAAYGANRVMNNIPVWIVTFHGVHMLHSCPCMMDASGRQIPSTRDPYVFGDTNVVLDAETGEVLEGFSYNTPS
ncbi:MAG: hypothetical protein ACYDH4_10035 [Candidatus Cryosericum sp.]